MEIKELHLYSDNVEETERFYNTVLGVITESKDSNNLSFMIGSTRVIFSQSAVNTKPIYHFAFDIPNNKFDEAFEWTKARVNLLPVLKADNYVSIFDLWNAKSFYFYDNNGNLLELIARFDVDNQTDKAFDSSSMLYVSEIGIVSESASKTAALITEKYGVKEFAKQAGTDSFTALGDDRGLLVLVNNQRNWFPTNDLAKPFWTKIVFNNGGREDLELILE